MIAGHPTMELNEADIRRFGPEMNVLGALEARIPKCWGGIMISPILALRWTRHGATPHGDPCRAQGCRRTICWNGWMGTCGAFRW